MTAAGNAQRSALCNGGEINSEKASVISQDFKEMHFNYVGPSISDIGIFFRGEGLKNWPNLPMDNSKKLLTGGGKKS